MINTPHCVICPAGEEALDELLSVYRQCEDFLALGPVSTASVEMVKADLALSRQEGGIFYGIEDRPTGKMIGVVDFVRSGWEGSPECAFLSLLMLAAPWRSKGLGSEIVQAVEEEIFRDPQIRWIKSGVQVNNPVGIRFWQQMGYAVVSRAEDQPDGTTAYRLLKDRKSVR